MLIVVHNFEIIPAFPSVIAATKIDKDLSSLWNLIPNLEFMESTSDDSHAVYTSKDLNLLNSLPDVKKILLDSFLEFKNNTLNYTTTDFEITTSWMTKTETNGFCQYHAHKNSFYSGVLYKNKSNSSDSGNLMFVDAGVKDDTLLINTPHEWNLLNSKRLVLEPDENLLIFFPSYLRHRISKYTGEENRYSLAFNLFPVGKIGSGDSTVNVRVF